MQKRTKTKYVHQGQYVAAVEVTLIEDETGWSPYLSREEAYKLDDVREALRKGDLESAMQYVEIIYMAQAIDDNAQEYIRKHAENRSPLDRSYLIAAEISLPLALQSENYFLNYQP